MKAKFRVVVIFRKEMKKNKYLSWDMYCGKYYRNGTLLSTRGVGTEGI